MSEGLIIALAGLLVGGGAAAAIIGWIRFHKKDKVEVEAQRQATLGERFDDASELAKYVREQVEAAVAPLREEIETMKRESHEMHDAFRSFFTDLWKWDYTGRTGPLPIFPATLLLKLKLGHLINKEKEEYHG
ncbi:hypothetical protein HWC34_gp40 [Microbacterium phage Alex44]|uniref:Membrane protein n=5 Tax=Tinytimothyvirus alex44 TaxID=2845588 RepID=A0A7G9A0H4_9CAUD|nr:hypothetical protein HWC34_gp40 [Microbacterium phage Alex44]AZV01801.1 hypothetical protein SEA_ARMAWEN_39 [Microbacterium phage ArMaWen]QDF16069.1 hypothetical protein SEA_LILYLOU_41 [Microbacterium phage LilyLou]QJD52837.1 hypothetical protein SEA_PHOGO_40 [Microbacterium phage Phogo]QNL30113.1 membrane protein [Microbacterium phage Stormbreaker]QPX62683.1 membrane protein [Microbacterium phage Xitlalli]UTN92904.1 membrane protein [Microbacterium phage Birdfeeder]WNM73250.1 hypothetica